MNALKMNLKMNIHIAAVGVPMYEMCRRSQFLSPNVSHLACDILVIGMLLSIIIADDSNLPLHRITGSSFNSCCHD